MKKKYILGVILALLSIMIITILAIKVYAASTGINTELNESAIVRLSGAIAMGNNTDRIVTRDAVETVLSGYNLGSSDVTVTDDITNDFIIVKYSATSREYKIDKNTIYTITYNANGGSGAPASQEHKHNESTTLSTIQPTRSNYRFRGWSTNSTATSATYQPGATYTVNGDVTLYAVWQAMYTVTYNANGGSGAPASQIKYDGEPLTLQTGTPTRSNYRFLGWSTSSSATSKEYDPGGSFTKNANTTLYAVWQAIYTITYNANGGSGAPLAQTKYHGESITLQTGVPISSLYMFFGWSTSPTATSAEYQPGDSFTTNANTTLYAVWISPYIPTGFGRVNGTDLDTGYVIEDSSGNQYVWVEVPKTKTVYRTAGLNITQFTDAEYTSIENDLHTYTSVYRNGTSYTDTWYSEAQHGFASAADYNALKNKMLKSVYQNGGFYVGRYEAGTLTARTSKNDTLTTPVIQANAYPYNYLTNKQAQTLADSMSSGEYTSSLMFGVQWDLVLKYLETKGATQSELKSDSTEWGNYYNNTYNITNTSAKYYYNSTWTAAPYNKTSTGNILLTTGASSEFSKQNISDLAGNVFEWTLEYTSDTSNPCARRGGYHFDVGSRYPASYRRVTYTTNANREYGFRLSLF